MVECCPQGPGFKHWAVLAEGPGYKYLVVLGYMYIVFNMASSGANADMCEFEKSLNWQQQQSQVYKLDLPAFQVDISLSASHC